VRALCCDFASCVAVDEGAIRLDDDEHRDSLDSVLRGEFLFEFTIFKGECGPRHGLEVRLVFLFALVARHEQHLAHLLGLIRLFVGSGQYGREPAAWGAPVGAEIDADALCTLESLFKTHGAGFRKNSFVLE